MSTHKTLGIVGDGHLARLVAGAARDLGATVRGIPAASVAELLLDPARAGSAARALVAGCDAVTVATERCPAAALRLLGRHAPLQPSADAIAITQDRAAERAWCEARGMMTASSRTVTAPDALREALREVGGQAFLKPLVREEEHGHPVFVRRLEHAQAAWDAFGGVPLLVEEVLPIELEFLLLVARGPTGELVTYPPALSQRQATRLSWTLLPAPVKAEALARAKDWAREVADGLELTGVATLELFATADRRLVLNEVVVGPHPALAGDESAYRAGQCEQLSRAALGLPLAPATPLRPTATAPITGDLWQGDRVPDFERVRALGGVRVSFYGDRAPAGGRLLGHVSASAETGEGAVSLLLAAQRQLVAGAGGRAPVTRTATPEPTT